jgi:menaquinone-dependent protoporphyrinogen oxidase
MARILVLYGTTDGHTARIARSIGDTLRTQGAEVDVLRAHQPGPDPNDYKAIIVAASVHASGYQRPVRTWVRTHAHALSSKPTAFVSVCLGVLQSDPDVQQEVRAIANRFLLSTEWRPTVTKIVAGALLYREYNWLKRWVMKRIVTKAGGDTDTSRNYEYTDWNDLRAFAEEFGRSVGVRPSCCAEGASTAARVA